MTPFFTKEFFEHKDELLLISRHGIGYNNIDLDAAKQHDTIVSIIPALVERDAVAENNVTNLLAVLRQTVAADASVKADQWEKRANFVGRTLFNKTVGVIGVGNTGSCVVETLRNGFRCDVLAYDPYKSATYLQSYGAKKVDLDTLLASADIICLCANLTEESYHMIGSAEIAKMKDGVYLSNGLGTDVLEEEPGRKNHPYLAFENVVMTPHTSAYTMECLQAMGEKCVQDVEDVVQGILPQRAVQEVSRYVS